MTLKPLLDWAVLAVSFFNTISLFWLGLMVLLIGNRRSLGNWATGLGLLLGALFFTSHTAILGRGLAETGFGMNFWWWVSWSPAIVAPLAWYVAMLWYSGFRPNQPHPHRVWLAVVTGMGLLLVLLLVLANPLPSYQFVAGRTILLTPSIGDFPILILAYLAYSFFCYLLPLDLFRRPVPTESSLENRSRRLARPWLVGASVAMLLAALLLTWTASWVLSSTPAPTLGNPGVEETVKEFDLMVAGLIAVAVTLLGRSIVAFEVFTGVPLPRDRFFSQWRATVLLAFGFGAVAAWTLVVGLRPVYTLMLATALMTLFYALFSWRSFRERENFMQRLRPFLASQNLYDRLSTPSLPERVDPSVRTLFDSLCRDLLETRCAVLAPAGRLAALAGPPLTFPPGQSIAVLPVADWVGRFQPEVRCLAVMEKDVAWAVPLWAQDVQSGVLFLGQKKSGSPYTEEEIELAQTGGERLLDLLAGFETARLSLDLLRQRLVEARLLEGQGRRVLHDEVLPELHTALLFLSEKSQNQESIDRLSAAHRRISDLLRASQPDVPARLARGGLVDALHSFVAEDLKGEVQAVTWLVDTEAEERAADLQPERAEAAYFAARELLRNAARYARGEDPSRPLTLTIAVSCQDQRVRLAVEDDGVGMGKGAGEASSGSGLRIHSAMLAALGGSLEVQPGPSRGTRGVILI